MSVIVNTSVSGGGGTGGGGTAAWGGITGTLSAQTDLQTVLDTKVTANAPLVVTAGFTFAKATHANRRIEYNAAGAANATFDGTAAFTTDDSFRLMQDGVGAITLLASGVTFSNPKSLSLTTTGAGTWIDAEWNATLSQLIITNVSPLASAGTGNVATINGSVPASVTATGTNIKSKSFTIPAGTLGKNGAIRITAAIVKSGAVETAVWSVRMGTVAAAFSGMTNINNNTFGAAVGSHVFEAWVYANGTDQLSLVASPTGGSSIITPPPTTLVAQTTLSINHGTTDVEIAIGGNGGATTGAWIVQNAQCVVMPGA